MADKLVHPGRLRHWLDNGDEGHGSADELASYLACEAEWLREDVCWHDGSRHGERLFELSLVLWTMAESMASNGEAPMRVVLDLKRRGATPKGGRAPKPPEAELLLSLAAWRARSHMIAGIIQSEAIDQAMKELRAQGRATAELTVNAIKVRLRHLLKRWPLKGR